MFIDTAKIFVKAGDGGDGCNSLYRDKFNRLGRPDGGDGGDGGNIILRVNTNISTLLDFQYRRHFKAERGRHGSGKNKRGANGADCIIDMPAGVIVKDASNSFKLCDLTRVEESITICKGGKGGSGNSKFRAATAGQKGEEKDLILELKLIADISIIGFPNAGKSTLISKISNAKSKIADYPFTTRQPILGVVRFKDIDFVVADIPGLIEGSHLGKGLGDRFLRHIERTKIIVHLLDMSSLLVARSAVSDYKLLNKELRLYSKELLKKPQILVANKMDLEISAQNLKEFKAKVKKKIYPISALNGDGLESLLKAIVKNLLSLTKRGYNEECKF